MPERPPGEMIYSQPFNGCYHVVVIADEAPSAPCLLKPDKNDAGIGANPQIKPADGHHLSSVMPALVAGIHVFLAGFQLKRRGWPGQARP
jgi:hypothetical protein